MGDYTKHFRINLDLSAFFYDHRRLARVFINRNLKSIEDLHSRITEIFQINDFYLATGGHFLPASEGIGVLNNNETVCVIPNKSREIAEQPVSNVTSSTHQKEDKKQKRSLEVIPEDSAEAPTPKKKKDNKNSSGACSAASTSWEEEAPRKKRKSENCKKDKSDDKKRAEKNDGEETLLKDENEISTSKKKNKNKKIIVGYSTSSSSSEDEAPRKKKKSEHTDKRKIDKERDESPELQQSSGRFKSEKKEIIHEDSVESFSKKKKKGKKKCSDISSSLEATEVYKKEKSENSTRNNSSKKHSEKDSNSENETEKTTKPNQSIVEREICNIEKSQKIVDIKKKLKQKTDEYINRHSTSTSRIAVDTSNVKNVLPKLQSHIKNCNTLGRSTIADTVRLSRHVDTPIKSFSSYKPIPRITDEYLANNKVNIVRIDVVKKGKKDLFGNTIGSQSLDSDNNIAETSSEKSNLILSDESPQKNYVKDVINSFEKNVSPELKKYTVEKVLNVDKEQEVKLIETSDDAEKPLGKQDINTSDNLERESGKFVSFNLMSTKNSAIANNISTGSENLNNSINTQTLKVEDPKTMQSTNVDPKGAKMSMDISSIPYDSSFLCGPFKDYSPSATSMALKLQELVIRSKSFMAANSSTTSNNLNLLENLNSVNNIQTSKVEDPTAMQLSNMDLEAANMPKNISLMSRDSSYSVNLQTNTSHGSENLDCSDNIQTSKVENLKPLQLSNMNCEADNMSTDISSIAHTSPCSSSPLKVENPKTMQSSNMDVEAANMSMNISSVPSDPLYSSGPLKDSPLNSTNTSLSNSPVRTRNLTSSKRYMGIGTLLERLRDSASAKDQESDSSAPYVTKRKRVRKHRKKNKKKDGQESLEPVKVETYTPKPMNVEACPRIHIKFEENERGTLQESMIIGDVSNENITENSAVNKVEQRSITISDVSNENIMENSSGNQTKHQSIIISDRSSETIVVNGTEHKTEGICSDKAQAFENREEICVDTFVLSEEDSDPIMENKSIFGDESISRAPLMADQLEPKVGDVIAFKVLKINEDYTPEVTNYVVGKLKTYLVKDKTVCFKILRGENELLSPTGKLSLQKETDLKNLKYKQFLWTELIEPKLLFP